MQSPFVAGLVGCVRRFRACIITTSEDGGWCPEERGLSESVPVRALGAPCAIRYPDIIKRREASRRTQTGYRLPDAGFSCGGCEGPESLRGPPDAPPRPWPRRS